MAAEELPVALHELAASNVALAARLPSRVKARLLVGVAVLALLAALGSAVGVWLIRSTQTTSVAAARRQRAEADTIASQSTLIATQSAQLARQGQFDAILGRFVVSILTQRVLTPAQKAIRTDLQHFLSNNP